MITIVEALRECLLRKPRENPTITIFVGGGAESNTNGSWVWLEGKPGKADIEASIVSFAHAVEARIAYVSERIREEQARKGLLLRGSYVSYEDGKKLEVRIEIGATAYKGGHVVARWLGGVRMPTEYGEQ